MFLFCAPLEFCKLAAFTNVRFSSPASCLRGVNSLKCQSQRELLSTGLFLLGASTVLSRPGEVLCASQCEAAPSSAEKMKTIHPAVLRPCLPLQGRQCSRLWALRQLQPHPPRHPAPTDQSGSPSSRQSPPNLTLQPALASFIHSANICAHY